MSENRSPEQVLAEQKGGDVQRCLGVLCFVC